MPACGPRLRLGFAGTPPFAAHVLSRLLDGDHLLKLVLTQPDRPTGRGRKLASSPVAEVAARADIETLKPATLRDPATRQRVCERLEATAIDVLVVVAYGLILPRAVLELPPMGCINVHASLLPRWRGAAPVERAIIAADDTTGVTIMAMDEGLDTGPVYAERETSILATDTGDTLRDRLAELGAELLLEVLADLPQREPRPQAQQGVSYARKLAPDEAAIDWTEPAPLIARKIRAFNSRMPAFGTVAGERVRLLAATAQPDAEDAPPGAIVEASPRGLRIATGAGCLSVTELQLARGKGRPMSVAAALNGHPDLLTPGRRFDA